MTLKNARDAIIDQVDKYFVGPGVRDEVINDTPWEYYHTGMLWPKDEPVGEEEDDQDTSSGMKDDPAEGLLSMANCSHQSAMAISAQVLKQAQKILINVSWAEYAGSCVHHEKKPPDYDRYKKRKHHDPDEWQRYPFDISLVLDIEVSQSNEKVELYSKKGIKVQALVREIEETYLVTVVLINARESCKSQRYTDILYQARIELQAESESPFVGRVNTGNKVDDDEFWLYELLYQDSKQFAVGHGCSAEWDENTHPVTQISSIWIPRQKVAKASSEIPTALDEANTPLFDNDHFLRLSKLKGQDGKLHTVKLLEKIVDVYQLWIKSQIKIIPSAVVEFGRDSEKIQSVAEENMDVCQIQLERIRAGIDFIAHDHHPEAWRAFCLANETIEESMRKARPDKEPKWRLFQLAFLLMALPSTLQKKHEDRDVLDLIWFPTGGGKTEAYLGLGAALLFYKRLKTESSDAFLGTSIFTRYTLRLLTIQQFERAATMICAANVVSGRYKEFERFERFSIGLFVGSGATPNNLEHAKKILDGNSEDDQCTTLPIQKCPWCKSPLAMSQQVVDFDSSLMVTPCSSGACEFGGETGIPIAVVDEEIYEHPPSIVIGTVDKFAMMAWEPKMRVLFSCGDSRPDLIIQDELHLISDALGTVTALYEGAVDYITKDALGPIKIIGSTATIRRAEEHVRKLFNRKVAQFPPSGISARDSFFYQIEDEEDRLYLGLHCQGRSPKHSLARLSGNILQSNEYLDFDSKDPFYTLVMYFNSMRELGGALVLLEDDVPRYLDSLPLEPGVSVRKIVQKRELTSQLDQAQLAQILDQLDVKLQRERTDDPVDAVLSTNMISVGVDVSRLNAMIVNGQPKNTAEYIQASSRVGREPGSAGVVFTLYNWTRPRDRSHYERFKAYHLAFYRHVESTSVTPYAARARDRALHAVLFSIARQTIPELAAANSAGKIIDKDVRARIEEIKKYILGRVQIVDASEYKETKQHLDWITEQWSDLVDEMHTKGNDTLWSLHPKEQKKLLKNGQYNLAEYALLKSCEDFNNDERFATPTSMRDVEPPTNIQLINRSWEPEDA